MHKILLLEDDRLLAQSLIDALQFAAYEVVWMDEGDAAAEAAYLHRHDLYLFDVGVPGMNGFELLQGLRESGDMTPAIFLTARHQIDDLARGFAVGGDDYIKKPFDLEELLIRIASKMPKKSRQHFSEDFSIDASDLSITCKNKTQSLPAKEFALLSLLCRNMGQFVAPEVIISALSGERQISIATLRTHIKNLKRHLSVCARIENMKGVGYRFKTV